MNLSADDQNLYDATRYAWRLDPKKAQRAEIVLAVQQGMIIGVFVADEWLESTPANFPRFPEVHNRWGFVGHPAPNEIAKLYLHRRIPESMRKRGAANPIRYMGMGEEPVIDPSC